MKPVSKHAYLIIAYDNWKILKTQLKMLDYPDNDIYLTVDLKSKDFAPNLLPVLHKSELFLMDRFKIYWADFSQVKAMLEMIKKALASGKNYSYFHFFSGTCIPLKTQQYIHQFCDSSTKEFIGVVPNEYWYSTKRVKYYYPFINTKYYKRHKSLKALVQAFVFVQRICGVNRLRNYHGIIYNGWDWASITSGFASYLIEHEKMISDMFQKALCPSELWIHTLVLNSEYKDRLYDSTSLRNGSMRYIDWHRGRPYIFGGSETENDYQLLMNSPYMFARKFSEDKSSELVERIYNRIMQEQQMNEKHNPNGFIEQ